MILRPVETIRGWEKIAKRMGRSVYLVQKWQNQGAPIYLIDGKWTAEIAELWTWLKDPEGYNQSAA